MNKTDLAKAIAAHADVSQDKAGKAIDAMIQSMTDAFKKGDTVTFVGFGSFKPVKKEARQGRNPRTGETIKIPASKSVRFSVGKGLKDTLNG